MANKISDKTQKALRAAVSRYNAMLSRYQNKYDPDYLPPRASIKQIIDEAYTEKDIRNEISRLRQFRTLQDFEQAEEYDFPVSIGEVRDLKRVTKLAQDKARSRANKIRGTLGEKNAIELEKAVKELQLLETKREPIKAIRTRKQFEFRHRTATSELVDIKTKMVIKNKYRLINTIKNVGKAIDVDLSDLAGAIENMDYETIKDFLEDYGGIDIYEIAELASLARANAGRIVVEKTEPGQTRKDLVALNNALGRPMENLEDDLYIE